MTTWGILLCRKVLVYRSKLKLYSLDIFHFLSCILFTLTVVMWCFYKSAVNGGWNDDLPLKIADLRWAGQRFCRICRLSSPCSLCYASRSWSRWLHLAVLLSCLLQGLWLEPHPILWNGCLLGRVQKWPIWEFLSWMFLICVRVKLFELIFPASVLCSWSLVLNNLSVSPINVLGQFLQGIS